MTLFNNRQLSKSVRGHRDGRVVAALILLVVVLGRPAGAVEISQATLANQRCLNCHGQDRIATLPPDQRLTMVAKPTTPPTRPPAPTRPGLFIQPDHFKGSPHAQVACVSCHADAAELPHAARLSRITCDAVCHSSEGAAYRRSAHAEAYAKNPDEAPNCVRCHGGHDIVPAHDPRSRVYPLNVVKVCSGCHKKFKEQFPDRPTVASYLESVHGKAISQSGLIVAATCASCHNSHDVRPAADPESSVHRNHIPKTCGRCHAGVAETYMTSIHGKQMSQGNEQAPVCIDCHTAHSISHAATPGFMKDIVRECGDCHNKPIGKGRKTLYETYRQSYHGQSNALGSMRAAKCSDCHGAHDILPPSDPLSRLHGDHRLATCSTCHPKANARFAQYRPHADWTDRENYPILYYVMWYFICIMTVTFSFYGIHSLLWFIRSILHRVRHGRHRPPKESPGIRRFNRVDRVNHAFIIISFFGLTLTGMPLFFAGEPWAVPLADLFGGAHAAGLWHRGFAIMLAGNFLLHFAGVIKRIRHHSFRTIILGPNSLLPRWRDVTDFGNVLRWFFGGPRPTFDRWTYWEKFDYWAEIFGTAVIGLTGLMLWFPEFTSQLMPGWMFNVATVIHGYEAMLAIGFIFTIHFFNAHLRMEKFPVDDVMFTGQLPEAEFIEERGLEYQRLCDAGELESFYVPPPPWWYRPVAVIVGVLAMLIGLTMVTLIVLAGLGVM